MVTVEFFGEEDIRFEDSEGILIVSYVQTYCPYCDQHRPLPLKSLQV